MRARSFNPALLACLLISAKGHALEAREIFKLAEPSIVVVLAADAKANKNVQGSGVVVAPQVVLTSCKVVDAAVDIVVAQSGDLRPARIRFADVERDLCQLHLQDPLPAARVALSDTTSTRVEIGDDLFLISAPRGLERTFTRLMVTGLREASGGSARLIQMDGAQDAGSAGGGLFDSQGRLVGILSFQFRQPGAAIAAIPLPWVDELRTRVADQSKATRAEKPIAPGGAVNDPGTDSATPPGLPKIGDRWKYRLLDGKRAAGVVVIEVADTRGNVVSERVTQEGQNGFLAERNVVMDTNTMKIQDVVALPGGYQLAELAPYNQLGKTVAPGEKWRGLPVTLLLGGYGYGKQSFQTESRIAGQEKIRVPAGTFDTTRVQTTARKSMGSDLIRVTCNYWYSIESMRTIKMSLEIKYSNTVFQSNTETYELLAYEPAK